MTRSKRGRCPETSRAGSAARACRIARAAHLHGRAKQARGALVGEHADSVIVTTINAETAETAEILGTLETLRARRALRLMFSRYWIQALHATSSGSDCVVFFDGRAGSRAGFQTARF